LAIGSKTYTVVHKKTGHYIIGDNFVRREPIFTIFAPLRRELNLHLKTGIFTHFKPLLYYKLE